MNQSLEHKLAQIHKCRSAYALRWHIWSLTKAEREALKSPLVDQFYDAFRSMPRGASYQSAKLFAYLVCNGAIEALQFCRGKPMIAKPPGWNCCVTPYLARVLQSGHPRRFEVLQYLIKTYQPKPTRYRSVLRKTIQLDDLDSFTYLRARGFECEAGIGKIFLDCEKYDAVKIKTVLILETHPNEMKFPKEKQMVEYVFSIDCESVGLYGETFAVAVSVRSRKDNVELAQFYAACPIEVTDGYRKSHPSLPWLSEHVLPVLPPPTHQTPRDVRDAFWLFFMEWNTKPNCIVVADCGAPVEAYFFHQCVRDDELGRRYQGPYPLHELGTVLLLNGQNPTACFARVEGEEIKHHPLHDARQSGRLFIEYMGFLHDDV